MFTEDESQEAIIAVATFTNRDEEELQVLHGDTFNNLIYVAMIVADRSFDPHAWIYSLDTSKVYGVSAETDPEEAFDIIADRDSE